MYVYIYICIFIHVHAYAYIYIYVFIQNRTRAESSSIFLSDMVSSTPNLCAMHCTVFSSRGLVVPKGLPKGVSAKSHHHLANFIDICCPLAYPPPLFMHEGGIRDQIQGGHLCIPVGQTASRLFISPPPPLSRAH